METFEFSRRISIRTTINRFTIPTLEDGFDFAKRVGIPKEIPSKMRFNCARDIRVFDEREKLFKIKNSIRYETMEEAIEVLRNGHPVAATLFRFSGWDGETIYRGPYRDPPAEFEGFYGVIMLHVKKIGEKTIVICKNSNSRQLEI